jgi:hypothetical protein
VFQKQERFRDLELHERRLAVVAHHRVDPRVQHGRGACENLEGEVGESLIDCGRADHLIGAARQVVTRPADVLEDGLLLDGVADLAPEHVRAVLVITVDRAEVWLHHGRGTDLVDASDVVADVVTLPVAR